MSTKLRHTLLLVFSTFLVLCVLLTAVGYRLPSRSFPQTQGEIHLQGLDAPVDIYRDEYGIPQIYASTQHDLLFAQGYVHAQDRFWQMDVGRHIGTARLSEMFGESQLETDKYLRTLGWARVAQKELAEIDPDFQALLQAYVDGVNAYLADHQGAVLSLEYAILSLLAPEYKPESWSPVHTLVLAKTMAWDLSGNINEEIQRAMLRKTLTAQQVDELFPPDYPSDLPVIVPNPASTGAQPQPASLSSQDFASLTPVLAAILEKNDGLSALLSSKSGGAGSNSWVISGKLTATGKPLLANDSHMLAQMPSIWYEIGLHCKPKSPSCPTEVTGFSPAGTPGVPGAGHNDRIAWGTTNLGADVMDLYIEKINPDNPDQYEVNGQWVDMQIVSETIQVAKGSPVQLKVRYTRHGPVISDVSSDLAQFNKNAGIEVPPQFAISLRWTALDVSSRTYLYYWKMHLARNWDDFRQAAADFEIPAQNLIYADVDGNIGYQTPGKIPIRSHGDGRYPVPGWTDEYEWIGFIPFDQLPSSYNPPQGFFVTANNAVTGPDYPYLITADWTFGYRAKRITEMIQQAPGPIDLAYMEKMQGDNLDLTAQSLVPILSQLVTGDPRLEQARALFDHWDFQAGMESAPEALFAAFTKHLLADTFYNKLEMDTWPGDASRVPEVVLNLAEQPDSPWWDDPSTSGVETRDMIFSRAFQEAVDEMEKRQGKDPTHWNWGDLHTLTFRNQTLGQSGIAPVEALFNRGPFRTSGSSNIVNATNWNSPDSYEVGVIPSMRMIIDLSNLDHSLAINSTGESGHAYHPHYKDMVELWRTIQYHPMVWDLASIQAAPGGHLRLIP